MVIQIRLFIAKVLILTSYVENAYCSEYLYEEFNIQQALSRYSDLSLQLPKQESDGRIQTLNQKGAMSPEFDQATLKFIKFSKEKKVLEVGGAYGKVMIDVLTKYPNTIYHLNDLNERHLFIAAHQLNQAEGVKANLNNQKFISGDICKGKINDAYDGILIARVLHFFSPEQVDNALKNIFDMLKPGGQAYVVAITPYVKRYERFIPEYKKRLASHEDSYPGHVQSLRDWIDEKAMSPSQMK